jgi:hypothetical protein
MHINPTNEHIFVLIFKNYVNKAHAFTINVLFQSNNEKDSLW